jgi:hypothetical protein
LEDHPTRFAFEIWYVAENAKGIVGIALGLRFDANHQIQLCDFRLDCISSNDAIDFGRET